MEKNKTILVTGGTGSFGEAFTSLTLEKFEPKKTNLEIKKGSTLFMQGNCIHGSYPNHSNRSRPLLSISYIPKGTKFIRGKNANRMEIPLN